MTNELMELIATITGYAVIFSVCVFVITMGVYYTIHRVIDALKVRNTFIAMKKQRNKARTAIDKIYNESDECRAAVIKHYGVLHD